MHLRKLEPTDLPYLYQWENDAASWPDGGIHNPVSQHDLRQYIASSTGDIYSDGQLRLIVEAEGCTVGCVDLFDLDVRNRRAAIGMYIAPDYRHRGLGRRAIELLREYAFAQLGLRMIYAIIATGNQPCAALYRSLNFESSSVIPAWTLESDVQVWTCVNS